MREKKEEKKVYLEKLKRYEKELITKLKKPRIYGGDLDRDTSNF
jgi:ribosome biogenesis protein Nip4